MGNTCLPNIKKIIQICDKLHVGQKFFGRQKNVNIVLNSIRINCTNDT